jgi:cation diffusion facilitator CzcD-associated flavoprotein CzcO
MTTTETIIIGAGQAGLALSWHLTARGRDHVVLDRGRIGERWQTARWESLHTLTPNWMTRLPGSDYEGTDPHGFMTMPQLVARFEAYAGSFRAPVFEHTRVEAVASVGDRFEVLAGGGRWRASNVVVATGWADRPFVPECADRLPAAVEQLTSAAYRRPDQIAGQRVLVVGASASGAQIARELARAGRDVTVAVGGHRRVPRRYRGRDIMWWLDQLGTLDRLPRNEAERRRLADEPSLPLSADTTLDLNTLADGGIAVTGRLIEVTDGRAWFADDLATTVADAEGRLRRLLDRIDRRADQLGIATAPDQIVPVAPATGPASLALGPGGVDAVVWATGFRRAYPWLHVPVLDARGDIRHQRGITPAAGLFVAGMRLQSGRRSTFIDGARLDAPVIADAIERRACAPARRVTGRDMMNGSTPRRLADTDYDVLVVGARCAGAATAMLLARAGLRVMLVDRSPAGTDTLSTHALMRAGVIQLHRWGLLDRVIAAGTPAVRQTVFRYGEATTTVSLKPVAGVDALYAPRRTVLDLILVQAAAVAGADLRFDVSVTDVERSVDGRVIGVVGHDDHHEPVRLRATLTIGADGLHSTVARAVGAPVEREATNASSFIYAHVSGLETGGYEWLYAPGVTAALIPTNDGQTCVSVGAPRARFRAELAGDIPAGFRRLLAEASPPLAQRVAAVVPPRQLRSFPGVPGLLRRPWGPGWALVGDAGYYKDPVTAHGMSDALRDAQLLANAAAAFVAGDLAEEAAMREYHETRNRLSLRLFEVTETIASYEWDTRSVEPHLRALSASMVDEVDHLLAFEAAGTSRPAGDATASALRPLAVASRANGSSEGPR